MTSPWKDYQEEAAAFFRSLSLDASTDVTVRGVRTAHDIDVVVKSHHVGFDVTWLVECKHWNKRVSKLHVLALREIVTDVGADRGILLSEAGFQSGAIEAATLTNVQVTSLAHIRSTASNDVLSMRLRELFDRVERCKERYWEIPKTKRIEHALRPDVGAMGYSGKRTIDFASGLLSRAFRAQYPITSDNLDDTTAVAAMAMPGLPQQFASAADVVAALEPLVAELEVKLGACEAA